MISIVLGSELELIINFSTYDAHEENVFHLPLLKKLWDLAMEDFCLRGYILDRVLWNLFPWKPSFTTLGLRFTISQYLMLINNIYFSESEL